MRILHLSTFTDSGAARGSVWLHDALKRRGVDSVMMVGSKRSSSDPTIHRLPSPLAQFTAKLRMRLDHLPLRRYDKTDESFWSLGWLPARFDRMVDTLTPDLIHIHWVGAGFMPINALKQFRVPIVWTLRDMWNMTGGCHYTAGCDRYLTGCGRCPQLRSNDANDLSHRVWLSKRKHWHNRNLWLVPISHWLADCAQASPLLGEFPIEVIPNGLDTALFRPVDQAEARRAWNLPQDRQIIVYGAINATRDARKGFRELLDALKLLGERAEAEKLLLVVFGDLKPGDIPDCGVEQRYVGYQSDNKKLSQLYSAADVAVMPSLQEAFGKTLIEAMACSTPVVAFGHGGPVDIISHKVDGYLAAPFQAEDLAQGIDWCLRAIAEGRHPGAAARAKVVSEFDIDVVAARYHDLYTRMLATAANPHAARQQPANETGMLDEPASAEYMPSYALGGIAQC
jgi:glycosyltransferase involved in cell wall biosynthesis